MTIDASGQWWRGTEAGDIEAYLRALSADDYPVGAYQPSECTCGGSAFFLEWLTRAGAARRTCVSCGHVRFICDSEENWNGKPRSFVCVECGCKGANVGVGFSFYRATTEVRWVAVGVRCTQCGVLGCVADWKIGYEPSGHLVGQA